MQTALQPNNGLPHLRIFSLQMIELRLMEIGTSFYLQKCVMRCDKQELESNFRTGNVILLALILHFLLSELLATFKIL